LQLPPLKVLDDKKTGPEGLEARIIRAIDSVGPKNVSLLSRRTGAHAETIRYKIKRQFNRLGLEISAQVDYRKLGLRMYAGTFSFMPRHENDAAGVMGSLSRTAYLISFAKVVPQGNYAARFALPPEAEADFRQALEHLRHDGVLQEFSLDEIVTSRSSSMNPKFFNFRAARWDVDWDGVVLSQSHTFPAAEKDPDEVADYYDILIITELQAHTLQHIVGIARKLKVHQKTLEYHYRTHVQKMKLIPRYLVRWTKDTRKRVARPVSVTNLTFRRLSKGDLHRAQDAVGRVPFVWNEDVLGDGSYLATLAIPSDDVLPALEYLNTRIPDLASAVEVGYVKRGEMHQFNCPRHLYGDKGWKFSMDLVEAGVHKELN
jgi:DNA-binding Lrp family transcriptional regulator